MPELTKDAIDSSQREYISRLAKKVQDESLNFCCASALYGLTKLFYDADLSDFIKKHPYELSELTQKCHQAVFDGNSEHIGDYIGCDCGRNFAGYACSGGSRFLFESG